MALNYYRSDNPIHVRPKALGPIYHPIASGGTIVSYQLRTYAAIFGSLLAREERRQCLAFISTSS